VLADLRDVSIILLAIESIIIGVILLLLLWQVRLLVLLLRDEIRPILKDTQETTQTVQSTTRFVGKRVAKPFVNAISVMAGVRGALKAMTGDIAPVNPVYDTTKSQVVKRDSAGGAPSSASAPTTPSPSSPDSRPSSHE